MKVLRIFAKNFVSRAFSRYDHVTLVKVSRKVAKTFVSRAFGGVGHVKLMIVLRFFRKNISIVRAQSVRPREIGESFTYICKNIDFARV